MPFVKIDVKKEINERLKNDKQLEQKYNEAQIKYELKKEKLKKKEH